MFGLGMAAMIVCSLGTIMWAVRLRKTQRLHERLPLLVSLALLPFLLAVGGVLVVVGGLWIGVISGGAESSLLLDRIMPYALLVPLGLILAMSTLAILFLIRVRTREP